MRFLKLGIISVFVFAFILFLMSLMIPSRVRISRAINITGSKAAVAERLSSVAALKSWNEIVQNGIDVEIDSVTSAFISSSWRYGDKKLQSAYTFAESGDVTVVQWYFDFDLRWYPWEKFASITLDKQFGPPMEQSLNNLKTLVEKSP